MAQAETPRIADYAMRFPHLAPILNEWLSPREAFRPESVANSVLNGLTDSASILGTYSNGEANLQEIMDVAAEVVMDVLDEAESPDSDNPDLRRAAYFAVIGYPEAADASLALDNRPIILTDGVMSHGKSPTILAHEGAILGTAYLVSALKQGGPTVKGQIAEDHFNAGIIHLARAVYLYVNSPVAARSAGK